MKRPETSQSADVGLGVLSFDPSWVKGLPHVCEFLCHQTWDDGTPREVSTITIKAQDGRCLVTLNDKELTRSMYASGESVMDGLKALEKHLANGTGDWRSWMTASKKKR